MSDVPSNTHLIFLRRLSENRDQSGFFRTVCHDLPLQRIKHLNFTRLYNPDNQNATAAFKDYPNDQQQDFEAIQQEGMKEQSGFKHFSWLDF